ncbi:MAG: hypothetical protein A2W93_03525 [Bacteroidetes bacterium GWF2_43_63]|nr:MAG: hypothetical protein A2W93_03525 [Bacteroidetes bacterium GWF2_43_63]HBG70498.1 hypothetical protein [Bacteroidales bacterium]HCB61493.1 hypothetical protein [Bacteroidales bacterium]
MSASSIKYFLKSLNDRAKKETDKGIGVCFNAFIVSDNRSQKLLEKEPIENLNRKINNLVKTETPEIVKVDLFNDSGQWLDGNVCDLRPKIEAPPSPSFQGLGEAEINAMVERRFDEKRREYEFVEMREIVKELSDENDELKARIEELETQNNDMQDDLEKKKQFRYYAGMLGDILESIGIRKEKLSKPIAELMGIDEKEVQKQLPEKSDQSGIVEEQPVTHPRGSAPISSEDQKRTEVISLISQFLYSVDNQLLGELFTIFSEIESNRGLAAEILEYIEKKKDFAS